MHLWNPVEMTQVRLIVRVEHPQGKAVGEVENALGTVMEYSTVREAIGDGLTLGGALDGWGMNRVWVERPGEWEAERLRGRGQTIADLECIRTIASELKLGGGLGTRKGLPDQIRELAGGVRERLFGT